METETGLFSVEPETVCGTQLCLPAVWGVSHYSCTSNEHNQLLVKAILDQVENCELRVWMLADSKIAGRERGRRQR